MGGRFRSGHARPVRDRWQVERGDRKCIGKQLACPVRLRLDDGHVKPQPCRACGKEGRIADDVEWRQVTLDALRPGGKDHVRSNAAGLSKCDRERAAAGTHALSDNR